MKVKNYTEETSHLYNSFWMLLKILSTLTTSHDTVFWNLHNLKQQIDKITNFELLRFIELYNNATFSNCICTKL